MASAVIVSPLHVYATRIENRTATPQGSCRGLDSPVQGPGGRRKKQGVHVGYDRLPRDAMCAAAHKAMHLQCSMSEGVAFVMHILVYAVTAFVCQHACFIPHIAEWSNCKICYTPHAV